MTKADGRADTTEVADSLINQSNISNILEWGAERGRFAGLYRATSTCCHGDADDGALWREAAEAREPGDSRDVGHKPGSGGDSGQWPVIADPAKLKLMRSAALRHSAVPPSRRLWKNREPHRMTRRDMAKLGGDATRRGKNARKLYSANQRPMKWALARAIDRNDRRYAGAGIRAAGEQRWQC